MTAVAFSVLDCFNREMHNGIKYASEARSDLLDSVADELILRVFSIVSSVLTLPAALLAIPSILEFNIRVISERGLDPIGFLKVNMLFLKTMLIGILSPLASIISPQLIYRDLEAYQYLCFSAAELVAEIPYNINSIEEIDVLNNLPDQGDRIQDWRSGFAEVLSNEFLRSLGGIEVVSDWDLNRYSNALHNFLERHYTVQEVRAACGNQANQPADYNQSFARIFKDALIDLRKELIQNEIYKEEEIATMDVDAYASLLEHSVLRIIENSTLEGPVRRQILNMNYKNRKVSFSDNNDPLFLKLKKVYSCVSLLNRSQLKLLKDNLNHKENGSSEDRFVLDAYGAIVGFRGDIVDRIITGVLGRDEASPIDFGKIFTGTFAVSC